MAKRKVHDARRRFRKIMKGAVFMFRHTHLEDVKHKSIILNEGHKHSAKLGAWAWEIDLGDVFDSYLVVSQPCHYKELTEIVQKYCTQNNYFMPHTWTATVTH